MTDNTGDLILRAMPFFAGTLLFYSWAILVALQAARKHWETIDICMVSVFIAVGTYFVALALGFSGLWTFPTDLYDVVRVCIGMAALLGLPVTIRQIAYEIRERRDLV